MASNGENSAPKALPSFTCGYCSFDFARKENLKRHLIQVHKELQGDTDMLPHACFTCNHCSKNFARKDNLKRHLIGVHKEDTDKLKKTTTQPNGDTGFPCNHCNKNFDRKDNLKRHLIQVHKEPQDKEPQKDSLASQTEHIQSNLPAKFACSLCHRNFTHKQNLKRHLSQAHQQEYDDPIMKAKMKTCIQPNCDKVFYHRTKMLKHLEDDHDLILSSSTHRFDTEREFLDWKENEEKDNLVQFTKQRGDKLTKGGRYIYYICEHDGSDKPHCARGQPARLSSRRSRKGRVKTGSICPARMLVKSELNSSVMRVTYISTHNHEPRPRIESSRHRRTCSRTTPRRMRTSQGKVAPGGIELQASNLPTAHTEDNNAAFLIEVDLDNEDMDTDFEDPQSEVLMREEIKGYLARLTELMEDERVQRTMLPRVHDVLKETVAQCEAMTAQPASTVVQLIHPEPLGQPFPGQREHDYICI